MKILRSAFPTTFALALLAALPASADDAKKLGWAGEAGLSLVATAGNSEGQTLGFAAKGTRTGELDLWTVEAGGLRTSTTTRVLLGTLNPDGTITLRESKTSRTTAESYLLRGRYDRGLGDHLYWFGGAGYERNTFAGFDSRTSAVAGLGRKWVDTEATKFKTDLGLTYTRQENVIGTTDEFAGARLSWDYARKISDSTSFANVFALDENFDDTDDLRIDTLSTLAVALNSRLALQVGLRLLYDHQPGFERLKVQGLPTTAFRVRELDDLDSTLTTSLVVKF